MISNTTSALEHNSEDFRGMSAKRDKFSNIHLWEGVNLRFGESTKLPFVFGLSISSIYPTG